MGLSVIWKLRNKPHGRRPDFLSRVTKSNVVTLTKLTDPRERVLRFISFIAKSCGVAERPAQIDVRLLFWSALIDLSPRDLEGRALKGVLQMREGGGKKLQLHHVLSPDEQVDFLSLYRTQVQQLGNTDTAIIYDISNA